MLIGPFLGHSVESHLRAIDVNCRGPLMLAHHFGQQMSARKRGGIILMTSLSGMQGAPWLASYGATKAFNIVLAEGLWYELKPHGSTSWPVARAPSRHPTTPPATRRVWDFSPQAVDGGQGRPRRHRCSRQQAAAHSRGAYRASQTLLERFASRKRRITIMGNSTEKMYGDRRVTLN
ncbi:short chain dehydrogenase family protein [Mycobacterium kansasii]|uniref:Short chain dehydrogenase family protein n=1 Tax=Mycobacterium kansasii TaxID=1768 RepID=A0A1V3WY92_MYCKA|nr:short chain dehydrogenase family protein [Mycobacterium kansasii]